MGSEEEEVEYMKTFYTLLNFYDILKLLQKLMSIQPEGRVCVRGSEGDEF